MHLIHGNLHCGPAVIQKGRVAFAGDLPGPVGHQNQFRVQIFPSSGIPVSIVIPCCKDIVQTPEIVRASADGGRSGQGLGACDLGDAIAKLLDFLLVDIGPVHD